MKTGEDSGAAIKGRHVSRLIFLTTIMHAGRYHVLAITHASSGYKSQRRDRTGGGETQLGFLVIKILDDDSHSNFSVIRDKNFLSPCICQIDT
jgi:hypothetical protein